jgi:hypothetical protein
VLPVQFSDTECCRAVPVKLTTSVGALLVMVTLAPDKVPVTVGANFTVRVAVWLGVRTRPDATPLAVIPVPAVVTPDMVIFAFPVFVTTAVSELFVLRLTSPKARLVGLDPSCTVAAEPLPLNGIVRTAGEPFVVRAMEPVTVLVELGVKIALNDMLAPAAIVVVVERPVMLKAGPPVTLTCENVSMALPVFFSVILWEWFVPITTLPKAADAGFAEPTAWTPVPVRAIDAGEPGALLVIEMLPFALPVTVGVKVALKVTLAPAAIVWPAVRPFIPKPVPEALAAEIVISEVPVFVSLIDWLAFWLTLTLPKLTDTGDIASTGWVPVPVSDTVSGEFDASLTTVIVPVIVPVDWGTNWTWTVLLCPTGIEGDALPPITVKPVPEMVTWETLTVAVPVFVTLMLCVAVPATGTLPKLSVVALGVSSPVLAGPAGPAAAV